MRDTAPFLLDVSTRDLTKALAEDGDIIIEGYAADFEPDREGESFVTGAFDRAVAKATKDEIPLLAEHDNNRQLGVVEKLEVRDEGLWTRARIARPEAGTWAADAASKIERGMMKGLSVRGLSQIKQTPKGPQIVDIDLAEISVTPVPMQPGALFKVAEKSLALAAEDDLAEPAAAALEAFFETQFADLTKAFERAERARR